jgi:hypothetical protein
VRILFVLFAVCAVYFAVTHTEFHFYTSNSGQPMGVLDALPSAAVVDVRAIAEASASSDADEAAGEIKALLVRATDVGPARGAVLIRHRLPALAAVVEAGIPLVQGRMAAVTVRTDMGASCRDVVLDLFARQRHYIRMLASDVAASHRTWRAVDRFAVRENAVARWYSGQIARCTQNAAPYERAALNQALRSI